MNPHVDLEIGALTEGFIAAWVLALVRLCARVKVHMRNELCAGLKSLAAHGVRTLERLA